jgi:hypothetical protein
MQILMPPKRQSDLVNTLGMTPDQARRLLDALSSLGGFSFRRSTVGERQLTDGQFELIGEMYRDQAGQTRQVTQEFIKRVITRLSSLPPEEAEDPWRVALNIAVDLGETRSRVLAVWQLLEQAANEHHLKLPDWQQAFHQEGPANAK